MSKRKPSSVKTCVECQAEFTVSGNQSRTVVCSPECRRQRVLRRTREWAKARYVPTDLHTETTCEECGEAYIPYRTVQARFCSRPCQETNRTKRRNEELRAGRKCIRCGATCPRQPGPPVCPECKVDKRDRRAYERLRTLRRYGLTEATYQALMDRQHGRCGICGTADWGPKGPSIDHCHDTGKVRWLLCMNCNTGIGMFNHDPALLRRAADRIEQYLSRRSSAQP